MCSIHKIKECTFIWTWNTSYMDTNITHIQRYSNYSHIITRTQFPIQLVITRTIHRAQGLTLDYLIFDLTNVYKHGLTYPTLSCVKKKGKSLPFITFANEFFSSWSKCCHGYALIANHCTMGCLQTTYILWFTCINLFSQY